MLLSWAGSYRWAYNWMVSRLEKTWLETGKSGRYDTPTRHALQAEMPWFAEIPAHILYGALMDAEKDYKLSVKKRSKGLKCELPRCRKRTQRSFFMLGNAVGPDKIYPRRLGEIASAEPLPLKPKDCRIIFEAGKFWLRVPYEVANLVTENQGRVCAVDPGIRTFATVYSPEGVGKVASGSFSRIQRLAAHLDDLISRTSLEKNKQRKTRMKLAQARMRLRIRNMIDTLHFQTAGWLFSKFDVVIFPEANFTSAVKKAGRKIRAKSVRSLLGFAFARFRDRLKFKAIVLGKTLVSVCESYTSKTHNITGEIRHKLGGAKTIESNGIRIDRDINGALGIFLKALLAQPPETAHC